MDNWEDIYESLALELKREIAENYFSEKVYLEEEWNSFQELLEEFKTTQKQIFDYAWKFYFMLREPDLIEEFEKITGFPLKSSISQSKILYDKIYNVAEKDLKKKLFAEEISPFAFTDKGKFVKIFLNIYNRFFKILQNYIKTYQKLEKLYSILKEETEKFHKKFDMSYILNFFNKLNLSESESELGSMEDKKKIWEEISKKLRISIPEDFEKNFVKYEPIPKPSKIENQLSKLVKKAFKRNPENAKEIIKLVS